MEEQVFELLDNFDISIYEKNYKECMRFHEILNEMKSSKNFQAIIQKYEIRLINYLFLLIYKSLGKF